MPEAAYDALRRAAGRTLPPSSDYDLNPRFVPPVRTLPLRAAAVLVAFQTGPRGPEVLLTKRSSRLRHHPGQIAFPGGKVDAGDADAVVAALREAHEEIALPPDMIEVLGVLDTHETVTGFTVTPVLARVVRPFSPVPEAGEVDEVFSVPLEFVADLRHYRVEWRRWLGQDRAYYVLPYGPYYVWGATARMLRGLAQRLQP
jgi:8-oxo-dGTP pyrophosphatase MutT (NUDIX family)